MTTETCSIEEGVDEIVLDLCDDQLNEDPKNGTAEVHVHPLIIIVYKIA
jgi:hypothetical protein